VPVWQPYRWYIAGAVSIFAIETVLIVALIAQRARRKRAEERLRLSAIDLRQLTGRLLQAHETESRRIARELHDDFGQRLALLTVGMDLLRRSPPQPPEELDARIHELIAQTKQLSSSVEGLSRQLHPAKLEQLGLVAAIRGVCDEVAHTHGLKVQFTEREVPATISPDTALCLYRVAQEGLRNAVKHARAPHVDVELSATAETLSLCIVDEGIGFDPTLVRGHGGLGLMSMRERVLHLGGEITIDSQPSRGTRVLVSVPAGNDAPGPTT
jgi:signal transduction histidine kinase